MVGTRREWIYAGNGRVNESENRIAIPTGVLEAGILEPGERAHWSYDAVGTVVVSNGELSDVESYKHQGVSKVGTEADGYRCTVPKRFFADYRGPGGPVEVDGEPLVDYGQERHFVYREQMAVGDPRSCYVFTREQVARNMGDNDFSDSFGTIPRFFR